jgi:hypothetical protein
MKIPIIISGKKYKIKAINDLTTKEFIEMSKIDNLDYVKYIAWQTKREFNDAFFAVTSKTVEKAIGNVPDITKIKRPKGFDYKNTIQTVGQRHQVESSNLTGYELLVFTLAVSQAKSNNIDDVNKLRDEYLKQSFSLILPAGFFFFRTLQTGKNYVGKSLERLAELIKMLFLRNKLVEKD